MEWQFCDTIYAKPVGRRRRKMTVKTQERLYREYYNRIINLLQDDPGFEIKDPDLDDVGMGAVLGDDLSDDIKRRICWCAYRDVKYAEYHLAVKHHPNWYKAVCADEGRTACLRAWRADGGMEYLKYMEHKEAR